MRQKFQQFYLHITLQEIETYDTVLTLPSSGNLSTIKLEHVSLDVATAAMLAVTNLSVAGNSTVTQDGALQIEKVESLSRIFGSSGVACLDLDGATTEEIEQVEVRTPVVVPYEVKMQYVQV